jgi:hypothetical protein
MVAKRKAAVSSVGEQLFAKARAQITRSKSLIRGLSSYRIGATPEELRATVPEFLKHPSYRSLIWASPTPKSFDQLGFGGLLGIGSFEVELEWLVQVLLPHADLINEFLSIRRQAEQYTLVGDRDNLVSLLNNARSCLGVSLWFVEAWINCLQSFEGYKAQREFSKGLLSTAKLNPVSWLLINWMAFRSEEDVGYAEFFRHLADVSPLNRGFSNIPHILFGACPETSPKNAATMFAYADAFPVIDRYLFLTSALQALLASGYNEVTSIAEAISPLVRLINDPRLQRMYVLCGGRSEPTQTELDICKYEDLYASGQYDELLQEAERKLAEEADVQTLYYALRARQHLGRLEALSGAWRESSIMAKISSNLERVIAFAPDATAAVQSLQKLVLLYVNSSWASSVAVVLARHRNDERVHLPENMQCFHALRTAQDCAELSFAFSRFAAADRYLDWLAALSPNQSSHSVCRYIASGHGEIEPTSEATKTLAHALLQIRLNRSEAAAQTLKEAFASAKGDMIRGEIGLLYNEALLHSRQYLGCAQVCSDLFNISSYFATLLPLRRIVSKIVEKSEQLEEPDPYLLGQLPIVIVLDIFSRYVSPEFDNARTDAFKDFLVAQGVDHASDLAQRIDSFPVDQIVHFLKFVCVPDVLDQSLALSSTRAVEDERAKILVLLSDLTSKQGRSPPPELLEELRTIKTRQVVRETTLRLDQSKVYVNVEGIRKAAESGVKESWHRYRLITAQQGAISGYEDIQKALEAKLGEKITVVSLTLPATERNKLFARIVLELRDMFAASKEFGLDANLSTNIRHGFVMREIRGPLVARHLVTNKVTEAGSYHENEYWLSRVAPYDEGCRSSVSVALNQFSQSIDGEIERLKRTLLRMRSEQAPEGLFDFSVSALELQILQKRLDQADSFDAFFDGVIDFLWAVTNDGLERVREVLATDTLKNLNAAITKLQTMLAEAISGDALSSMMTATNLARTELAAALERVASWFTLSTNTEFQDYAIQIAYEAGLATVRSYYSDLNIVSECSGDQHLQLAGRTLPAFARLYSLLLENSAYHCGIDSGDLHIYADVKHDDGVLLLTVRNELSASTNFEELGRRIRRLNEDFGKEPSSEVVRSEEGSGYPKIWKILAHDLRGDHALEVSLVNNREFQVQIMIEAKGIVL